jgi:hypothetical protein
MDKREVTKLVARFITEAGAAYIVKEFIKGNVTAPTRIDKKIAYLLATFALVGVVAGKAATTSTEPSTRSSTLTTRSRKN